MTKNNQISSEAMSTFSVPGKWRQFSATFIINIATLMNGVAMGWMSPAVPYLMSNETVIGSEPMTDEQISWISGATSIGAIILLPFCGLMCERFGRKIFGCLLALPFFLCCLLKIVAKNYLYLIVARFLVGFSAAMFGSLVPIYVAEISDKSIRGQLGGLIIFALNIGLIMGYVLGTLLSYRICLICISIMPVIYFGAFLFMPETPIYLVRKSRIAEATKSLMWLKSNDESAVKKELSLLQVYVKESVDTSKSVGFKDLFKDRGTIKGFIIALVLLGAQETTGYSAMMTYTATIFELVDTPLTPNSATIVVGIIQIFGSWLSAIMTERAGRRTLVLISCIGMAMCHSILSLYFFLQTLNYNVTIVSWIPVVSLSGYAFLWSFGIGPISFIVASEVFHADISSIATSIALEFMWIISFLTMKFFPTATNLIGYHGVFMIFSFFCLFTFIFTYFIVPETKGRTITSIVNELNGCKLKDKNSECLQAGFEITETHSFIKMT